MSNATIVFDLDGTLIDTAPDLVATLNLLFTTLNIPPVPIAEARPLIGNGVRPLIERGLAAQNIGLDTGRVDSLYARFIAHYAEHIADASRPFPGVVQAMDVLAAEGAVFAVCTNKLEWLSVKLLTELDLARRFAAICGQDTFSVRKPHPDALRQTILRAGGDPQRAILVGDSETDITTGRAAGIPVIAVDFGYSTVPVSRFDPDCVISDFGALPAVARRLLGSAERV